MKKITEELASLFAQAVEDNIYFAAYRLPIYPLYRETHKQFATDADTKCSQLSCFKNLTLIFSTKDLTSISASQLRQTQVGDLCGFAFHPFDVEEENMAFTRAFDFLPAEIAFCPENGDLWVCSTAPEKIRAFAKKLAVFASLFQNEAASLEKFFASHTDSCGDIDQDTVTNFEKRNKGRNLFHYRNTSNNDLQQQKTTTQQQYEQGVEVFLQKITEEESIVKAVLSAQRVMFRKGNIKTSNLAVVQTFLRILFAYPFSMACLFSSAQAGTWLTASPEMLSCVSSGSEKTFRTVSLAGTQSTPRILKNINHASEKEIADSLKTRLSANSATKKNLLIQQILSEVKWSEKEIEEQALVSRYIVGAFKKIRLREYKEHGPRTVMVGGVLHLASVFEVNFCDRYAPELLIDMLCLLHPTSAVCGYPKPKALQAISNNETHPREYYAGFFGPYGIGNLFAVEKNNGKNSETQSNEIVEADFYVNIRTLKISDDRLTFYAGAGIVAGSNPASEWKEVGLKMDAMQRFFKEDR